MADDHAAVEAQNSAAPRACAVCKHICPVMVLTDLELAEVCEFCKPLVLELVKARRLGAGMGDRAIDRAVQLARELDQHCADIERATSVAP
jgi:hypothetical protein